MPLKDYFTILELEPSASLPEIKKAYRKLAQLHHPDKTGNDPYSAARFAEIKEAYEVLTDPAKKEYYLQQRWYHQSMGRRKTQAVMTPETLLKQVLELERYVSRLDIFRMDRQGLLEYMLELFPDETLEKLRVFNDRGTNHAILETMLRAMKPLKPEQAAQVLAQLQKLAPADPAVSSKLNHFLHQAKKRDRQEKYGFVLVLVITVLICIIIYLLGR
ncbi:MAG: J domain-containing protein [Sphingobacteriales bacterium]|nr:J domain-containing protein [Sphingobacteriales bacterium]